MLKQTILPDNISRIVACLLLMFAVTFVYYQGLHGPWLLDDADSVTPIEVDGKNLAQIAEIVFGDHTGIVGRPLTILTFVANHYFNGSENPFPFKATNLCIHLLIGVIVFLILRALIFEISTRSGESSANKSTAIAFICASLWLLHPLNVSTVLYVMQRMAMLSTLFTLLSICLYISLRRRDDFPKVSPIRLGGLACCITLAVLAKENGVLVFGHISLIEIIVFRFKSNKGNQLIQFRRAFILLNLTTVFLAALTTVFLWEAMMGGYVVRSYGVFERLMSQAFVISDYVRQIIVPDITTMSLYYDAYPVPSKPTISLWLHMIVILAAGFIVILGNHRHPILSLGLGIFLIAHLLESTFLPLEPYFEHRNYLAMIGIILPAVWYGDKLIKLLHSHRSVSATYFSLVCLILASLTYSRTGEWSDTERFHATALERHPDSIRTRNAWTSHLATKNKIAEALEHLELSSGLIQNTSHFTVQRVMFTGALDKPDNALYEQLLAELSANPVKSEEVATLGEILTHYQKGYYAWPDLKQIAELHRVAINNESKLLKPQSEAVLISRYARLLYELGEIHSAKEMALKALKINENSVVANQVIVLTQNTRNATK